MKRRRFLAAAFAQAATPPNVLVYLPAQMRACDLGCYGGGQNVATSNFDRMAREGMRFRHAISTVPLSTPFRAMLQTGKQPLRTRAIFNGINIRSEDGNAMAEVFARAGYVTSYIGCWHLAAGRLGNPAVRTHAEFVPPGKARMGYSIWHAFNYHTEYARPYFYRDEPRRLLMPGYETDAEATMALEVMHECRMSRKPFFLMVAPHPPHPPWRPSHTPPDALEKVARDLTWRPNVIQPVKVPDEQDPRCYYGLLKNVDQNLGKMLDYIDKNDLASNTIVLCASDHGEMLGSHGKWGSMHPHVEALQIPLLVRWPGKIATGAVSDKLVAPVDIFPSLLELCGIAAPEGLDGRAVFGPKPFSRERVEIANYTGNAEQPEDGNEWRGTYSQGSVSVVFRTGFYFNWNLVQDPYQSVFWFRGARTPNTMPAGSSFRKWYTPSRDIILD
jgi:arylsulfatase A-like enzyme